MKRTILLSIAVFVFAAVSLAEPPKYTLTLLGSLGGSYSIAYGINDAGQVVGQSRTVPGDLRAFLWQNGVMTDLGTLGGTSSSSSRAYGINDAGQVVGKSDSYAFLWQEGTMYNLSDYLDNPISGWSLRTAQGINSLGQIVGYGCNPSGYIEAFLLTPVTSPPVPVCVSPLSMDANKDCKVDFLDFVVFASQWMTCGYDIQEACWQ